ncbi:anti-sigma factor [Roseinatronobacter sp. NSM]|uniref:anti-sigma factor n=1 Tax=Roseinatronobacter sp. NSM TaxID=3457785 RepID=UPI0040350E81
MSAQPSDTPTPDDVLAAEYVLGLLDGDDWQAAKARAAVDSTFAARVQAWETRLSPLNDMYEDAHAPAHIMTRTEAQLFPAPPPTPRRSWFLGLASGTAFAAILMLALMIWDISTPPAGPMLQAELVAADRDLVVQARFDSADAQLTITLRGQDAGRGLDYELWVIDDSEIPRSLGVVRGPELAVGAELVAGQVLAVSLEPAGGSPTGLPTGAVLAVAELGDS